MNRSKAYQLLKIEKENENKDIKTKQKVVQTKGRLGAAGNGGIHIEKTGPIRGVPQLRFPEVGHKSQWSREPSSLNSNAADLFQNSTRIFPNHKPLGPYMAPTPGPKPRLGAKQIKRQPKTISLKKVDEKIQQESIAMESCSTESLTGISMAEPPKSPVVADTSAKSCLQVEDFSAVVTPRTESARNAFKTSRSDSLSEEIGVLTPKELESFPHRSDSATYLDLDLCSLSSSLHGSEKYHTAPLLPVPKNLSSACSTCRTGQVSGKAKKEIEFKREKSMIRTPRNPPPKKSDVLSPRCVKNSLEAEYAELVKSERNLRSPRKNPLASRRDPHKTNEPVTPRCPKRVSTFCQTPAKSLTQRKGKSILKVHEIPTFQSDDTDMESARLLKPVYEKRYAYITTDSKRSSPPKRVTRAKHANDESLLKKATTPKKQLTERSTLIEYPSEIEMKLHISDLSENDGKMRVTHENDPKQQLDVTFRNVRSLKKEIIILRALGDRLQATLEPTSSDAGLSPVKEKRGLRPSSSTTSLTRELKKIDPAIDVFPGRRNTGRSRPTKKPVKIIAVCKQRVGYLIHAKGLLFEFGVVQEFEIVPRTIDELRKDPSSNFYIRKDGQLECTSFEKLKTEPKILLENLKSKTEGLHFSVLDHDPIFFNSLIMPALATASSEQGHLDLRSKHKRPRNGKRRSTLPVSAEMKSVFKSQGPELPPNVPVPLKRIEEKEPSDKSFMIGENKRKTVNPSVKLGRRKSKESFRNNFESKGEGHAVPSPLAPRRGRIGCSKTPMPMDAFDDPKNCLWKRILIGFVQLSVFLVLIMALSLPDIAC